MAILSIPQDLTADPGANFNVPVDLVLNGPEVFRTADFRVSYDQDVLDATSAIVSANMPAGSTVILNSATPGLAIVTFFTQTPVLGGFSNPLVHLGFEVDPTASAGGQPLNLHDVVLSDGNDNELVLQIPATNAPDDPVDGIVTIGGGVPPLVNLSVDNAVIPEAGGSATFTASLSAPAAQDVIVDLGFGGTAGSGLDYTASATQIAIPAGLITGSVTVTAVQDAVDEADETVVVDITGVTGATESGVQQQTTTIADDDAPPTVTLAVDNAAIPEAAGSATFTASLSEPTTQSVTVNLGYSGTATSGADYTVSATQIVIGPGLIAGSVTVTAVQDAVDEFDEEVLVDVTSVTGATELGFQQQTTTIADDDEAPTVTLAVDNAVIPEGAGEATFTATLSEASAKPVTVEFEYTGTAIAGEDYTASDPLIFIAPGLTAGSVTVTAIQDDLEEADETFVVDILSVTFATESGTQQQTTTIIDDDGLPTVTLAVDNTFIPEAAGTATFTATLSAPAPQAVNIDLSYSGTATAGEDFTASGTQILIAAGLSTGSVTVTAVQDDFDEADETIIVDITNVAGAIEFSDQQQTATITDDDGIPTTTLAVDNATIPEAAGKATFTATLSAPAAQSVTVELGFIGTATEGDDYTTSATQILIAPGLASGSVTVTAVQDEIDEPDETVVVEITNVTGATELGEQQQTTTINDDDGPPHVTLTVDNATIAEAAGRATFTAILSAPTSQAVTVDLGFGGTATSGVDYNAPTTQIVIGQGLTTSSVTVTAVQDNVDEPDESVSVEITNVTGAEELGDQQQTTLIIDDDGVSTVTLAVDNPAIAEAAGRATFTATLSAPVAQAVTVDLSYSGTATGGVDYTASATQIVIAAGLLAGSVTVTAVQDTIDEPDETVVVDITNVTGAEESGTQREVTRIRDDDVVAPLTVSLSVDLAAIPEGGGEATFRATLSRTSSQFVAVFLAYSGSAVIDVDYTVPSDAIVIPAGALSGSLTVTAVQDLLQEPDEVVIVDILDVLNAREAGTQRATTTILDDDALPSVSLSVDNDLIEEAEGVATFTASLSREATVPVTVELGVSGTATENADYTSFASQIVIPAGATTAAVSLMAVQDGLDELDETVIVEIENVVNAVELGDQRQTIIIADDDAPPLVTLSVEDPTIPEEGGSAVFTATLSEVSGKDVIVGVDITGTARVGEDYLAVVAQIVIPAGALSGALTVAAISDFQDEPAETVVVDIASVINGSELGIQQQTVTIIDDDDMFEPNNDFASATALDVVAGVELVVRDAAISPTGDRDFFALTLDGPGTIQLDIDAREQGLSSLDSVLRLFDESQQLLAVNDNGSDPDTGFTGLDSELERHVDVGGTYFVRVDGFGRSSGAYELEILVTRDLPDDPFEDNNAFDSAASLDVRPGEKFSTQGAKIDFSGDIDHFSFELEAPGTIRLDTDAREQGLSEVDTVLFLFDESQQLLAVNDNGADPDNGFQGLDSALEHYVETGGTYFARVAGFGGSTGAYELEVLITLDVAEDPFEENNDFDSAALLAVSPGQEFSTVGSRIDPNDDDYYEFTVSGPSTIRLDTDAREQRLSDVDTLLFLFDEQEQQLAFNDNGVDPETKFRGLDSALEYHVEAEGTYFARVRGFQGTLGAYQLEILVTPDATDDPYEANDDFASASSLAVSPGREFSTRGAVIDPSGEDDYYRFTLAGPGLIGLDTDAREQGFSSVDTVLYLYDEAGQLLLINDEGTDPETGYTGGDSALEYHVDEAGTYFARVHGFASSTGAYELQLLVNLDAEIDPYEFNDNFASAALLQLSPGQEFQTVGALIDPNGEDDYFRFTVPGAGTLRLDTDAQEQGLSAVDTILSLYDEAEQQLAVNDDGIDPETGFRGLDSALEYHLDAGGTYFARVSGLGGNTGPYELEILFAPEIGEREIGDTLATATPAQVLVGRPFEWISTIGDVGHGANDVDLFAVDLPADVVVQVDVDAREIGSELDSILRLFDSTGTELVRNDDATDPESSFRGSDSYLEFRIVAAGTYYVGVSSFGNFLYDSMVANSGQGGTEGVYAIQIALESVAPPPPPAPIPPPRQFLYLNFEGGQFTDYSGYTSTVPSLDVTDFGFTFEQRDEVLERVVQFVRDDLILSGSLEDPETPLDLPITIVTEPPETGQFSTVFIGGSFLGLLGQAQSVDRGNQDIADDAAVYSGAIASAIRQELGRQPTIDEAAQSLADTISHEAGHLLGLSHVREDGLLMQVGSIDESRVDDERFGNGTLFHTVGMQDAVALLRQNLTLRDDVASINNTVDEASEVILSQGVARTIAGEIDQTGDRDIFAVDLNVGDTLRIDVDAQSLGAGLDSRVRLLDSLGQELASNDDSFDPLTDIATLDSFLEYAATETSTLFVELSGDVVTQPRFGVPPGTYSLHLRVSPQATEELFDAPLSEDTGKAIQITEDSPYVFTNPLGESIRIVLISAIGLVLFEDDGEGGMEIQSIEVSDVDPDSIPRPQLRVESETGSPATTRIREISVAGDVEIDLHLGVNNLRVDLARLQSFAPLGVLEVSGSLEGPIKLDSGLTTLMAGEVTSTGWVRVIGGLDTLSVADGVDGSVSIEGTLNNAQVGGHLTASLSATSMTSLHVTGNLGERDDTDTLISIGGATESITVGGDLLGAVVVQDRLGELQVAGNLEGIVRVPNGGLEQGHVGTNPGQAIFEVGGDTSLEFVMNGRGTAAHSIDILQCDGSESPVLELRDPQDALLSRNLPGGDRLSLAGYGPGDYHVELTTQMQCSLTIQTQPVSGEPVLAAVDIDADGRFNTVTDYRLAQLVQDDSSATVIESLRAPGGTRSAAEIVEVVNALADALDVDGNGAVDTTVDGRLISLARNGVPSTILEGFRAPDATRSGDAVRSRAADLLARQTSQSAPIVKSTTQLLQLTAPMTAEPGVPFDIEVDYSTIDGNDTPVDSGADSIGFRLHFNRGELNLNTSASTVLGTDLSFDGLSTPIDELAAGIDDSDPRTDTYILFTWTDEDGQFLPASSLLSLNASVSSTTVLNVVVLPDDSDAKFNQQTVDSFSVTIPQLSLVSPLVATNTGFTAHFTGDLDPDTLNLIDVETGGRGSADVVLSGASVGPVPGSLFVEPSLSAVTFVKTGGRLEPDTYTVTLRSAADGFKDLAGNLLDGDSDGNAGGDFQDVFTVTEPSAETIELSLPDFVRGAGQPVSLPADTTNGIPISISNGDGVRAIEFELTFDPELLQISDAVTSAEMPVGSVTTLDVSIPGRAVVSVASPTDLPAGTVTLLHLQAIVPVTAFSNSDRDLQILDFTAISIRNAAGGEFAVITDRAVHSIAYFGDVSDNNRVNALDASLVARFAALLAAGFETSPMTDPVLLADITGNGRVNAADASLVARFAALIEVPQIPPIPVGTLAVGQGKASTASGVAGWLGKPVQKPFDLSPSGEQDDSTPVGSWWPPGLPSPAVDRVIADFGDARALDVTEELEVDLDAAIAELLYAEWYWTARD